MIIIGSLSQCFSNLDIIDILSQIIPFGGIASVLCFEDPLAMSLASAY
jgi:hypothetical protein